MTGQPCPGCGHKPLAAHRKYCNPCHLRLPEKTRGEVDAAAARHRAAVAEAVVWLKQHPKVTSRELEIVELVSHGLSNAEIGARLHITEETVKSALRDVGRRWGCAGRGSRAQIVATAFRYGYLRTERTEAAL